jgi:hypothetical protein
MDIDQNPETSMATTGDVDMEGINNDYSMSSITPPEINVVDFAYHAQVTQDHIQDQGNQNQNQGMVYHSAPTSPRGTRMDTEMNMGMGRAPSAEPAQTNFPSAAVPLPVLSQEQDLSMGMGMGAVTPIPMPILGDRKPSLFTLMNSLPNTPSLDLPQQAQAYVPQVNLPQGEKESPTLFDGLPPISNHHPFENTDRERERRMSLFGSIQMSLPNAGGVGRLSLSKGSEGIGLGLGLEHVS